MQLSMGPRAAHILCFPEFNIRLISSLLQQQVRTWCGDVVDLPAAQGPADAVLLNACFGFMHDQHAALWAACRLLRPSGHVVISRPASG